MRKEKLQIKTLVADLEDYKIMDNYDVICALFSIHFLSKNKVYGLIRNMKYKKGEKHVGESSTDNQKIKSSSSE